MIRSMTRALALLAALVVAGCSAASETAGLSGPGFGAGHDGTTARKVAEITVEADRCGLTVDVQRNRKMVGDFEARLKRSPADIQASLETFDRAFADLVRQPATAPCDAGRRADVARRLGLVEDMRLADL